MISPEVSLLILLVRRGSNFRSWFSVPLRPNVHQVEDASGVEHWSRRSDGLTRLETRYAHSTLGIHRVFLVRCGSGGKTGAPQAGSEPDFQLRRIAQARFRKRGRSSNNGTKTRWPNFPLFRRQRRRLLGLILFFPSISWSPSHRCGRSQLADLFCAKLGTRNPQYKPGCLRSRRKRT